MPELRRPLPQAPEILLAGQHRLRQPAAASTCWYSLRAERGFLSHPGTNGAGNFAIWVGRFLRFRRIEQQLGPTSGSMGFGLPAAIGAARVFPDRTVVCFAGDGDFLMNGQEFATAVQYHLPIVVVLIDNGAYGTIRMHQEREFPGRVIGTQLRNPDFAAYARAFGGHGETVEETAEFLPAFERALASRLPAIVHVKIDPEAIAPSATLTAIRETALAKRAPS